MQEQNSSEQVAHPHALTSSALTPGQSDASKCIEVLVKDFYKEVLDMAFEWFPHDRNDGSPNERIYVAIRARVLRNGNNLIRNVPQVLRDFNMERVRKTELVVMTPEQTKRFNFPVGTGK